MPRAPIITSVSTDEPDEADRERVDPTAASAQADAEAGALSGASASPAAGASIRDDNPNSVSPELSPAGGSSKGGLSTKGVALALAAAGAGLIAGLALLTALD